MGVAHSYPRTISIGVESTFGSAGTFDFDSNGQEIYVYDCDITGVGQAKVPNDNYNNTTLGFHPGVLALKSDSTASWAAYLTHSGTHASEGANAASTALSDMLFAAMGGRSLNRAAGVDSNSGATVTVDTGEGTNFEQGDLSYIFDDDGHGEWYLQTSAPSTDDLTVDRTLHFTAGTSDTIKGVIQCYVDWRVCHEHDDSNHKTLAMAIKGVDSEDYWQLYGVKPSIEIEEIVQGQKPVVRFNGRVLDFTHETETADTLSGAPEGEAPLAIGTGDSCRIYLAAKSSSLSSVEFATCTPRIGIQYEPDGGPNGREGVHGWVATRDSLMNGPGIDMQVRFDDDYATGYRAGTIYHCMIMIGDTENASICIYYPYLEMSAEPQRAGAENLYSQLSFRALQNQSSAGSLTGADLRRWQSPVHIGMVA